MDAREETIRAADGYAADGFLCSEAVLLALSESMGVESELIPRIATGFAAGVARTGNVCGALSGAVMGLGLRYGRDAPETEPGRRPYWYSRWLAEAFEEAYGSVTCPGVLGLDLGDPDDYRRYTEKDMWATTCRDVIKTATGLAYDLLQREK
ncbi:MAG TPA: C-GCAxxG-C-C family protein [Candidatus Krumholzibacteriaceae bacterium]|nr:C-GCAxxG-C-C family protein [Candidatus Krumholzibacteriaceae bacterium]